MPELELEPELVLFGVLPPLLYGAAFFTSLRDLRANARPIGLLAIGLVVVTTVGVAVVAHTVVDGLTWPAAFVLGAIVSPTDPIAGDGDRPPARRAARARQHRRGGEPRERRDGARALPRRGRRGRDRLVLAARDGRAVRGQRRRRGGGRARGGLARASGAPPARQPAGRDHDLADDRATWPSSRRS